MRSRGIDSSIIFYLCNESDSQSCQFTPVETFTPYPLHRRWGGLQSSGMNTVEQRKISFLGRIQTLVVQLTVNCYTEISCIPH
jgi:hypothetical protein